MASGHMIRYVILHRLCLQKRLSKSSEVIHLTVDEKTKTEIMEVLKRYMEGSSGKDADKVLSTLSPEILGFGSGMDCWCEGIDEYHGFLNEDFSLWESGSATMEFSRVFIDREGDVAWVAADLSGSVKIDGEKFPISGKLSVVLKKSGVQWLCVLKHYTSSEFADISA